MDARTLLIIFIVVVAICLAVSILLRLTRIALVLAGLFILVPILCTIMWGDGTDFVSKFASIFAPEIEQGINDGYGQYRDQNAKDPIVDIDQLDKYFQDAQQAVKDQFSKPVPDPGGDSNTDSLTTKTGRLPHGGRPSFCAKMSFRQIA